MAEDKTESKPDPKTDEEHPLDEARREGLRLSPLSQTQHLDTTEGGITDLHRISPVFEEARQHAVRQGALAANEEYGLGTVIEPDDKDERERAREHVRKLAQDLPDEVDADADRRPPGGYADGQGQAYNPEMVEADAAARAGQEREATGTNPAAGKDADSDDKAEDEKSGAAAKSSSSSSTTTKTTAKPTPARSTSSTSKTTSK